MSQTALTYIQEKGFQHKNQGKEIILQDCPFCGENKHHFYLEAQEGQFFCHKCQEKGNLITLKKHLGDYEPMSPRRNGSGNMAKKLQTAVKQAFPPKTESNKVLDERMVMEPHERLLGDADALRYLTEERKITRETIEAFNLGLDLFQEKRWVSIPHYCKGKLVNIKYRTLPPAEKDFRRVTGCPSILFNGDCLEQFPQIHVCEGEIDTLTLWQAGIKNVIGVTAGAKSFDPSWVDQLAKVESIFLVYDPDEAGQKGAREAARRLGYGRCFNVLLPDGQDVNDFFKKHSVQDFKRLAMDSRPFDVAGVMDIEEAFERFKDEMQRPDNAEGLRTPWKSVNRRIRTGFHPGELVVLGAPPKIGKSTFALQIATFNVLENVPSLFFCLEMRPMKVIEKIIQCHAGVEILGPAEIAKVHKAFTGRALYLGYCYQKPDLNGVMETIKAAVQRYGLKLVVFDHLHFLCRSVTNQVQEISLAVQAFKFLAEEMEIPIILIAQPRKIQADAIMTAMDLKDSISIYSDCDHLIILHRNRKASTGKEVREGMETQGQAFEPITLVRVEASRYNAGGEALLYYHGEFSKFDELEKR